MIPRRIERRYRPYQKHTLPFKLRNPSDLYINRYNAIVIYYSVSFYIKDKLPNV